MPLYFAYGSNMGSAQMHQRCPDSRCLGRAELAGYAWLIARQGYASIRAQSDSRVEGVLWEISANDEAALDRFEEVALDVYRKHYLSVSHEGISRTALVYVDPITELGTAPAEYVIRMNAALADAQLSADYLARQIRPFIAPAQPDAAETAG